MIAVTAAAVTPGGVIATTVAFLLFAFLLFGLTVGQGRPGDLGSCPRCGKRGRHAPDCAWNRR